MAKETASNRIADKGPVTRSSTETMYKKVVLTPPTTRNRVDKGTPPPPVAATVTATTTTPMHLRRSERTRNLSPSTSSQSPSSKKLKSVSQFTFQERDAAAAAAETSFKLKTKDARAYRTVFRRRSSRDCNEESNRGGNLTQEGSDQGGARGNEIDECSRGNSLDGKEVSEDGILPPEDAKTGDQSAKSGSSGPVKELSEDNVTRGSSVPSDAAAHETSGPVQELSENNVAQGSPVPSDAATHETSGPVQELSENNMTQGLLVPSDAATHETSGASERVQSDCHREEEASQTLASRSSMLNENLSQKCANGENLIPCKRKRITGDKDSDVSATSADDENCNLIVDASSSRLCSNIVETSESCSKRIR